jgi:hypothetical protein
VTGRRGRRRKQLLGDHNGKKILEYERGITSLHSVEKSLWKRLWTCSSKAGYGVNESGKCNKISLLALYCDNQVTKKCATITNFSICATKQYAYPAMYTPHMNRDSSNVEKLCHTPDHRFC